MKPEKQWAYLLLDEQGNKYLMDGISCEIYTYNNPEEWQDIELIKDVWQIRNNKVIKVEN